MSAMESHGKRRSLQKIPPSPPKQKSRAKHGFFVLLSKGFEAEAPARGTTGRAVGDGCSEPLELKRSNFLGEVTNEAERKFGHRKIQSLLLCKSNYSKSNPDLRHKIPHGIFSLKKGRQRVEVFSMGAILRKRLKFDKKRDRITL